ncbi:MAG: sugar phosphate isomerase/epimerase family protein [Candidatus Hydrothermarchaeales archaeon]
MTSEMKLGAMNNPEKDVLKELKFFGELGFDFFELAVEGPRAFPELLTERKKKILDLLSSYDMALLTHLPWFFEIGHPYEGVRRAYLKETLKVVDIAVELEAEKLGLHINVPKGRFPDKLDYNLNALREIEGYASDKGLPVCVENLDLKVFDLDDFHRILDTGVGFLWDIGHANMGLLNEEDIFLFLELKDQLMHVHAHDNDGRDDLHLPIGAGKIDWKKVVKELKRVYDGTVTLEIHSQDRDYLKISREKFLELWK